MLLHGDLYARHLMLEGGRLVGVIDWGDVCFGDPAVDLGIGWTFLDAAARADFLRAVGPVDAGTRRRARLFGLAKIVRVGVYAIEVGDASLADEARRGVEHALSEERPG